MGTVVPLATRAHGRKANVISAGFDHCVGSGSQVSKPSSVAVEDGGCMLGTMLPPPPGFVPPAIEESLSRGFDEQTVIYALGHRPVVLWPDWDYAEDWSGHPLREIHPFIPVIHGKEITESEFRARVKSIHGIE